MLNVLKYFSAYLLTSVLFIGIIFFTHLFIISSEPLQQVDKNSFKKERLINDDLVFATVNGKDYLVRDLIPKQMFEIENRLYSDIQDGLYEKIKDEYKTVIEGSIVYPSDEEIRSFFDDNDLQSQGSFESFKNRIANFLVEQQIEDNLAEILKQGISQRDIIIHQPEPHNLFEFTNLRPVLLGNPNSTVALIEFSDMQCPFCKLTQPDLIRVIDDYQDRIAYYFRHLPIQSIHQEAFGAALGVECAIEQGFFAEYKKLLFDDQKNLQYESLLDKAKNLNGINFPQFESCLTTEKHRQTILDDLEQSKQLNISGTPTFFIGYIDKAGNFRGDILIGRQNYENFTDVLLKYL